MSSKYEKSPTAFYTMTENELKQYIRNAGKTLKKQLSRLEQSPFSSFSEKLERWRNESVFLRGRGFATKNLTTAELIDTAQVINNVISVEESSASLRDIVNRDIFEDFMRGNLANEKALNDYFMDKAQMNTMLMWARRNINMIYELLKSWEIQKLVKEWYDVDREEFYKRAFMLASKNAAFIDESEWATWWEDVDKLKSWEKK